jgi:hypothetical protein
MTPQRTFGWFADQCAGLNVRNVSPARWHGLKHCMHGSRKASFNPECKGEVSNPSLTDTPGQGFLSLVSLKEISGIDIVTFLRSLDGLHIGFDMIDEGYNAPCR